MTTKEGTLRCWWVANPPSEPFRKIVDSVKEARIWLDNQSQYDLYLEDLIICNAGGLEVYTDEGDWVDWYDDNEYDIDAYIIDDETGELKFCEES